MDQEMESPEDSHANVESSLADESPQPETISEEYFEEICSRANGIIQSLQEENQNLLSEEFQRLFSAFHVLRRSLVTERMKIDEMHLEIKTLHGEIAKIIKSAEDDKKTIQSQRFEIETAWREKDVAQNREQEAHKQLYVLRDKMEDIQKESEKYAHQETDDVNASMARQKDTVIRERDRLSNEVDDLSSKLQAMKEYLEEVEVAKQTIENKNKELYKLLDETSSESFKDKRLLESLKSEIQEVTVDRDQKAEEARHFKIKSEASHKSSMQHNLQIAALKSNIEKLTTQNTVMSMKLNRLNGEFENLTHIKEKLLHDLGVKANILKLKEDENNKFRLETSKLVKSKEMVTKKLTMVELAKGALDQDVMKLKSIILNMEKEQDTSRKAFDKTKSQIDNITRERDLVRKDLLKLNKQNEDLTEQCLLYEQQIRNLENEVKQQSAAIQRQREFIKKVERERDKTFDEVQSLQEKYDKLKDDIQSKCSQVNEMKCNIQEQITAYSQVQQQCEALKSEKLGLHRDLVGINNDLTDVRNKLKMSYRQTETAQKSIEEKDLEILKQTKIIEKHEKEKQLLKNEIQSQQISFQHLKSEMREKNVESDRLMTTISENEHKIGTLEKQIESLNNQKDLLNNQIFQQTEEIGALNEKLQNAQSALNRSEIQYANRLDDIRLLKIEIGNLRSQSNLLSRGLSNTADMRHEVLQLNRSLTQIHDPGFTESIFEKERIKYKAMEQEMTTPMNVHRWRELGGKDPEKMDLINKVQTLQKRVMKQNVEANEREKAIQIAQEAVGKMKHFALTMPNSDQRQKLNASQRALSIQNKKWKSAVAELKIKELDLKAKSNCVDHLKQSLIEAKQELLKEKKEKQKLMEIKKIAQQQFQLINSAAIIPLQQQQPIPQQLRSRIGTASGVKASDL